MLDALTALTFSWVIWPLQPLHRLWPLAKVTYVIRSITSTRILMPLLLSACMYYDATVVCMLPLVYCQHFYFVSTF